MFGIYPCHIRIILVPHYAARALQITQSISQGAADASLVSMGHTAVHDLLLTQAQYFPGSLEYLTHDALGNGEGVAGTAGKLIIRWCDESLAAPIQTFGHIGH